MGFSNLDIFPTKLHFVGFKSEHGQIVSDLKNVYYVSE